MFLANFQIHLRTSSATLNSLESAVVPLAGNGLTIWSRRLKSALRPGSEWRLYVAQRKLPEHRHPTSCGEQTQDNHIDKP